MLLLRGMILLMTVCFCVLSATIETWMLLFARSSALTFATSLPRSGIGMFDLMSACYRQIKGD